MPDTVLIHDCLSPVHLQSDPPDFSHPASGTHIPFSRMYFLSARIREPSFAQSHRLQGFHLLDFLSSAVSHLPLRISILHAPDFVPRRDLQNPGGKYHGPAPSAWLQWTVSSDTRHCLLQNTPSDVHGDDGPHCGTLRTIGDLHCQSSCVCRAWPVSTGAVPSIETRCHTQAALHPPGEGR